VGAGCGANRLGYWQCGQRLTSLRPQLVSTGTSAGRAIAVYSIVKRAIDLIAAVGGLLFLWPLLVVTALLVRWRLGTPVLFRDERVGLGERTFQVFKFRTMSNARNSEGRLLPDGQRLTRFGLWLRSWSLDELPQLINVMRGEMSLVGPRPLPVRYLPRYSERQRRRHEMKPGITGLAQVRGRNDLAWPEKLELDVQYVENRSLLLDFRILCETFSRVIRRSGVRASGGVEVAEFLGNHPCGSKADSGQ